MYWTKIINLLQSYKSVWIEHSYSPLPPAKRQKKNRFNLYSLSYFRFRLCRSLLFRATPTHSALLIALLCAHNLIPKLVSTLSEKTHFTTTIHYVSALLLQSDFWPLHTLWALRVILFQVRLSYRCKNCYKDSKLYATIFNTRSNFNISLVIWIVPPYLRESVRMKCHNHTISIHRLKVIVCTNVDRLAG